MNKLSTRNNPNEQETLLNLIKELIAGNILVVVEGKKDAAALRDLGISNLLQLGPHYKTIERLCGEKEVAILVDLDREGKHIYHRLKEDLSQRGVKVNDKLRNFLFRNTKVRQIEGLSKLIRP